MSRGTLKSAFQCQLVWVGLVLPLLVVNLSAQRSVPGDAKLPPSGDLGARVHGVVLTQLPDGSGPAIFVPEFQLYLEDANTKKKVAATVSDARGRYMFPLQPPGTYNLRWNNAGWLEGRMAPPLNIQSKGVYAVVAATPVRNNKIGVVWGRATMANGSPPFYFDEYFGVLERSFAHVTDTSGRNLFSAVVPMNAAGEYVVVNIPVEAEVDVQAKMGKAISDEAQVRGQSLRTGAVRVPTLTINNTPPVLVSTVAKVRGKAIERATGATEVECVALAADPDGDALEYRWKTSSSEIVGKASNSASWTLPTIPGWHTAYVLVSDRKGGYATGQLSVLVAEEAAKPEELSMRHPKVVATTHASLAAGPGPLPGCLVFPNAQPFLSIKQFTDVNEHDADNYYDAVDPNRARRTLGQWWRQNGFNATTGLAATEVRAAYLNNNDLGFGREMHLLKKGDNVAGYVTNYSTDPNADVLHKKANQDPLNADLALQADPRNAIATVCMEYSPVDGQAPNVRVVKFFVFAPGKSPNSRIARAADLDGNGLKFVPYLCLNCHGGIYGRHAGETVAPNDILGMFASFREFDLETYRFARPGKPRDDPSRGQPTAGEQAIFKQLNDIVFASNPESGIKDVIAGWYSGGSSIQNYGYTPPHWPDSGTPDTPKSLYQDVVKKSCRTCHVAFGAEDHQFAHDWTDFEQFKKWRALGVLQPYVCGPAKAMPHAQVTYCRFWNSDPLQPDFLKSFQTTGWAPIGNCPP